jgi:hypothetical protein
MGRTAVFGDDHDDLVRAGVAEALACMDMLIPAPRRPRRLARIVAEVRRLVGTAAWRANPLAADATRRVGAGWKQSGHATQDRH